MNFGQGADSNTNTKTITNPKKLSIRNQSQYFQKQKNISNQKNIYSYDKKSSFIYSTQNPIQQSVKLQEQYYQLEPKRLEFKIIEQKINQEKKIRMKQSIEKKLQKSFKERIGFKLNENKQINEQLNNCQVKRQNYSQRNNNQQSQEQQNNSQYQQDIDQDIQVKFQRTQYFNSKRNQIILHLVQYIVKNKTKQQFAQTQQSQNQQFDQLFYQRKIQKQIKIQLINQKVIKKLTPIKSFKQFLLNNLDYSGAQRNCDKIQISFFNLYQGQNHNITYQIENQQDFKLILGQWLSQRKDIHIRIQHYENLKMKAKKILTPAEFEVQFNSDGQFQEQSNVQDQELCQKINLIKIAIKQNYTDKQIFKGKSKVNCGFCHKSNSNVESIKKCGPFYGPFKKKNTNMYVHLLCAIWCYKVYLKDQRLLGVQKEVTRSQKCQCIYCNKFGAGLICSQCKNTFHYECVLKNCVFNWLEYKLTCNSCIIKQQKIEFQDHSQKQFNHKQININQNNQQIFIKNQEKQIKIFQLLINSQNIRNQSIQDSITKSIKYPPFIQNQKVKQQLQIDQESRFQINSKEISDIQQKNQYSLKKSKIIVKQEHNSGQKKSDSKRKKERLKTYKK